MCKNCKHAIWDYESFYNSSERQYFVTGCKMSDEAFMIEKNGEVIECDRFSEGDEWR